MMATSNAGNGSRADGVGYIDEVDIHEESKLEAIGHSETTDEPDIASGSSISEEEDEDSSEFEEAPETLIPKGAIQQPTSDEEGPESPDEQWDAGGEDWDLATGDFTKQYNRMRQLQAATTQAGPSRPVLPARNQASAATPSPRGVIANPKFAGDSKEKDKSDRATIEQVLDARTRLILGALQNRGVIGPLGRSISTGKEANVYYAPAGRENKVCKSCAIKIYRTSILAFRSRQNYIIGEQRFKNEYTSSKNPRKMVKVWAEKELRNLKRLQSGGVASPKAIEVKQNVLALEFLGDGEDASPRLKDAEISVEEAQKLYIDLLIIMRKIFKDCGLVHADLSEYNLIYHQKQIYVIDVSQSVEQDHPRAYDFLRMDIHNIESFFQKKYSIQTLGSRRLWEYIITDDPPFQISGEREYLEKLLEEDHDPTEDKIFMASFIPRHLSEVKDPEKELESMNAGKGDGMILTQLAEMTVSDHGVQQQEGIDEQPGEEQEGLEHGDDESEEGSDDEDASSKPRGFRHEDKDAKKERKKAVKEENRERRKQKMPKSEKQRLIKKHAR